MEFFEGKETLSGSVSEPFCVLNIDSHAQGPVRSLLICHHLVVPISSVASQATPR